MVHVNKPNGHSCAGMIPAALKERMSLIYKQKGVIKHVRLLPPVDAYAAWSVPRFWISDSQGKMWSGDLGKPFHDDLKSEEKDEVLDVAQAGDLAWIIIRPNRFMASTGVSKRLTLRPSKFYHDQKGRREQTNLRIKNYDARILRESMEEGGGGNYDPSDN